MKIDIKSGGMKYSVDFRIGPGDAKTNLTAMPNSSDDMDELRNAIINRGNSDEIIGNIIATALEKKLKLPVEIDYSYKGTGYGFKLDWYAIAKKLN